MAFAVNPQEPPGSTVSLSGLLVMTNLAGAGGLGDAVGKMGAGVDVGAGVVSTGFSDGDGSVGAIVGSMVSKTTGTVGGGVASTRSPVSPT